MMETIESSLMPLLPDYSLTPMIESIKTEKHPIETSTSEHIEHLNLPSAGSFTSSPSYKTDTSASSTLEQFVPNLTVATESSVAAPSSKPSSPFAKKLPEITPSQYTTTQDQQPIVPAEPLVDTLVESKVMVSFDEMVEHKSQCSPTKHQSVEEATLSVPNSLESNLSVGKQQILIDQEPNITLDNPNQSKPNQLLKSSTPISTLYQQSIIENISTPQTPLVHHTHIKTAPSTNIPHTPPILTPFLREELVQKEMEPFMIEGHPQDETSTNCTSSIFPVFMNQDDSSSISKINDDSLIVSKEIHPEFSSQQNLDSSTVPVLAASSTISSFDASTNSTSSNQNEASTGCRFILATSGHSIKSSFLTPMGAMSRFSFPLFLF